MQLSGPEKAAVLMLSLEEDQASPLLSRMRDDEILRLQEAVKVLPRARLQSNLLQGLYVEFARNASGEVPLLHGGGEYLAVLLRRALGEERASNLLLPPAAPTGPLDDVASDAKTLADMLAGEHPQTIAAVLAQVAPSVAGAVLTCLPEEVQELVIDRMSIIATVSPTAIRATKENLSTELGEALFQTEATVGISKAAAILNELLPEHSAAILARIDQRDPDRAAAIRREQFTFEDLSKLDRRAMQILLREVDAVQLTLSLKGASDAVRNAIFGAMSSRAAQTLREDLENMGPQRLADVEKAQREMALAATRMAAEGKIVLVTGGQFV